jgi:hypothetical protein
LSPAERTLRLKFAACFLLGTFAYLYLNLFVPPFTPICLGEDEGIWLMDAMRMLRGQAMYRDFFQFTAPGTQFVYFVLFVWFGPRTWVPNVLLILLGLGFVWLSAGISKRVMQGSAVFLPGLLFLTLAFRRAFAVTHHWWNELAVMGATAVIIEETTPARIAVTGLLCGLALWFNQTQGLLAVLGFAVFLLWESRRKKLHWRAALGSECLLFSAFLAATTVAYAYFLWEAGARRLLDCTVTFVLRYYPAFTAQSTWKFYLTDMPRLTHWHALPKLGAYVFVRALLPLVYIIFFICYRREARTRTSEPWDRMMLLAILGLFLFIGIVPAAAWFRFCTVSIPGFILLVWLVSRSTRFGKGLTGALWLLSLLFAAGEPWWWQSHWRAYLDTPGGRTAFVIPELYDKYQWVLLRTRASEPFFEAVDSDIYFTLGLNNPAEVPFVTATDFTRPQQVQGVIDALREHRVRYVLWSKTLDLGNDSPAKGDHLEPLRKYLRDRYQVVKTFPDFEQIWELKKAVPDREVR